MPMPPTKGTTNEMKEVTIFTDGGAIPNPGRGGYGVILRFGENVKELSGGYASTTNNRMELMAVIVGLEALKGRCRVQLYCDSKYVVDAVTTGSAFKWRDNGWSLKSAAGATKAKNYDLWKRLLAAYERHEVKMIWVKGHSGIDDNERCDQLASAAMQQPNLLPDEGYAPDAVATPSINTTSDPPKVADSKTKIREVGQPCRKCHTPVVKKIPKKKTLKSGQTYYYAWYLHCPCCDAMYLTDDAKRQVTNGSRGLTVE